MAVVSLRMLVVVLLLLAAVCAALIVAQSGSEEPLELAGTALLRS